MTVKQYEDEIFINIVFIITLTVSQLRNLMEESINNCSAWCMMNAIHKGCCGLELYHWEMHSHIIRKIAYLRNVTLYNGSFIIATFFLDY
jgi:hypothetical protein